jgi:F-type H+-transporting ATPase subunit gamma
MQMVSAAKMRKSQQVALSSRSYASLAWELIARVTKDANLEHELLAEYPEAKKVGVVVVSSNRGLVGSFNTNLFNVLSKEEKENADLLFEMVVLGKKAKEALVRLKKNLVAEFPKFDAVVPVSEIYPLVKMLTTKYATGEYKKIVVVYNKFVSTLVQKPTVMRLLPIVPENVDTTNDLTDYIYEPGQKALIDNILPRIVESQVYQAILESDASEHSARMVMMKNATEAAGDLIGDLTLAYNQLRQNKITTELAEITAGKIALEER